MIACSPCQKKNKECHVRQAGELPHLGQTNQARGFSKRSRADIATWRELAHSFWSPRGETLQRRSSLVVCTHYIFATTMLTRFDFLQTREFAAASTCRREAPATGIPTYIP